MSFCLRVCTLLMWLFSQFVLQIMRVVWGHSSLKSSESSLSAFESPFHIVFIRLIATTYTFIFHSHCIDILYVLRQKLFHMITGMVSINAMTIANSEEPIIPNLCEILYDEVGILVGLGGFVGNVASSGFKGKTSYRIIYTDIYHGTLSRLILLILKLFGRFWRHSSWSLDRFWYIRVLTCSILDLLCTLNLLLLLYQLLLLRHLLLYLLLLHHLLLLLHLLGQTKSLVLVTISSQAVIVWLILWLRRHLLESLLCRIK